MLMSKTAPVSKRCARYACRRRAAYVHHKDTCFAFCDEHWPVFERLMTYGLKPTQGQRDEAAELIADGMAIPMVAKRVGVSVNVVRDWFDTPANRAAMTEADIAEALRMRQQGFPWEQVAAELGRSEKTVKARLQHLPEAKRLSKYAVFFHKVRRANGLVRYPFNVVNPTTVAHNINTGHYATAPKGEFHARTIDGVVWVEAVNP